MQEIIPLFSSFAHCQSPKQLRQLSRILAALLTLSGRVTMLGLSRWGEKGTSYRTVQRFFADKLPWAEMLWLFFVPIPSPKLSLLVKGQFR